MSNLLKALFFASLQIPLVAFLSLSSESAIRRPYFTFFAIFAYEVVACLIAFSKKVWNELERDAVAVAANWIRELILRTAPGFRRRYRQLLITRYGLFNVRGLGLINTYTLPLDHVFVNLRIEPSNPQKLNIDLINRNSSDREQQLWEFLRSRESDEYGSKVFAIVGPPGSGKTTLLQHVTITFASNYQHKYSVRASTPILLFLRDHVRDIIDEGKSLADLLQNYLADERVFPALRPPKDWFKRKILKGRCIVLLDGLDEVGDFNHRQKAAEWIDRQTSAYPKCTFIVTSRPQGYRDTPLQTAHVLEIRPFSFEQVKRFINNWYLSNEFISSGRQYSVGVRERAEHDALDLIKRLQSNPPLYALTANPLLLTMISMVHRYQGALPKSRVDLYAEICEVLLGRWRRGKGIVDELKSSQKLAALCPLAKEMMCSGIQNISTTEAVNILATPLSRIGLEEHRGEEFLKDLQADSGLVLEREPGRWSFAHLTFQEYLTSRYWLEEKQDLDWLVLIQDSRWKETLRLYAGQTDATEIVDHCLLLNTVETLVLAVDLLEEAREMNSVVRRKAKDLLLSGIESTDRLRRRLAAEVLLLRRLNSLERIDEYREIDLSYITNAEFELFLSENLRVGNGRQPDCWNSSNFPTGQGIQPVTGLRPEDATAFCDWLNQSRVDNHHYRLPYLEEAVEHAAPMADLATWCIDGTSFRLIGLDKQNEYQLMERIRVFTDLPVNELSKMTFGGSRADEHALALAIGRGIGLNGLGDHTVGYTYSLVDLSLATKLAHDLNYYIEFQLLRGNKLLAYAQNNTSLALARDLAFDMDLSRNFINYFWHRGKKPTPTLAPLLQPGSLLQATDLIKDLCANHDISIRRRAGLIQDLLDIEYARNERERTEIFERYGYTLLNYAQLGSKSMGALHFEQFLSNIRWWRNLAIARSSGALPAWEGLRIVRFLVD